jgi:hypothetical protein
MRLLDRARAFLRSSPTWVALRRVQREGWLRTLRRLRLWRRVLASPPVTTASPQAQAAAEVHLLCHRGDYLCALWALKSFYHYAGVDFPLILHWNGDAHAKAWRRLRLHFPNALLVTQAHADREVAEYLRRRGFARLARARAQSPFMLKLTDFPAFARARQVVVLDGDVLFFARPAELVGACERPASAFVFQRDPETNYNLSPERARAELGVPLAPRVNTGIMVYPREALDLGLCEQYLEHPEVARPSGFIEQTLYALQASARGAVSYFPDSYLVHLGAGLPYDGVIARHYAGLSRPLLTEEGMPRLANQFAPGLFRRTPPAAS